MGVWGEGERDLQRAGLIGCREAVKDSRCDQGSVGASENAARSAGSLRGPPKAPAIGPDTFRASRTIAMLITQLSVVRSLSGDTKRS